MKAVKIGLIVLLFIGLVYVLVNSYLCNKEGKKSGRPFRCPIFSQKPIWMSAQEEYTMIIDKKCYEVTDYGERLTYKVVEMGRCAEEPESGSENEEETPQRSKSDTYAEYEMINENY